MKVVVPQAVIDWLHKFIDHLKTSDKDAKYLNFYKRKIIDLLISLNTPQEEGNIQLYNNANLDDMRKVIKTFTTLESERANTTKILNDAQQEIENLKKEKAILQEKVIELEEALKKPRIIMKDGHFDQPEEFEKLTDFTKHLEKLKNDKASEEEQKSFSKLIEELKKECTSAARMLEIIDSGFGTDKRDKGFTIFSQKEEKKCSFSEETLKVINCFKDKLTEEVVNSCDL